MQFILLMDPRTTVSVAECVWMQSIIQMCNNILDFVMAWKLSSQQDALATVDRMFTT